MEIGVCQLHVGLTGMEMGSWVVVLLNGNTAAELGAVSLYSFGAVEVLVALFSGCLCR